MLYFRSSPEAKLLNSLQFLVYCIQMNKLLVSLHVGCLQEAFMVIVSIVLLSKASLYTRVSCFTVQSINKCHSSAKCIYPLAIFTGQLLHVKLPAKYKRITSC